VASRVIVTGGAGFIGSHVVDALLGEGHEVVAVDDLSTGERERVAEQADLRVMDIVDAPALEALVDELRPSAIFHLAAQASVVASVANPGRDCDVNVKGTLNVLRAAVRCGAPVVYTSTGGALYGDEAPRPTPESYIPAPLSPYGASKWGGEAYAKTWSLSSGITNAICRLGNVYGPRQSPHGEAGVVAIFAYHLYTGRAPKLYGHGRPTRDYVYVGDVVRALLAAVGRSGTYNVATGVETDVLSVWTQLCRAAEQSQAGGGQSSFTPPAPELVDLRPGELLHSSLDIGLARRELEWSPQVPLREGLRLTYDALVEQFARD